MNTMRGIWIIVIINSFSTVIHGLQIIGAQQVKAITPAYKGFRLKGCVFQIILVESPIDCAQNCLANEQCKSTNYKPVSSNTYSICELNNGTKGVNSPSKFIEDPQFTYYEFLQIQPSGEPSSGNTIRFPIKPKMCSEFLPGSHASGNYSIYDDNGNPFTVWCHLDHAQGKAWTLVTSVSLANIAETSLTKIQLKFDAPVNDNSPNMYRYRMSLTRMKQIRAMSTYWYAVCNFNGTMSDRRDTVRGKFSELDPIAYTGNGECKKVEYINIRGFTCKQCTVLWYQVPGNMLHVDSSVHGSCDLDASTGAVWSEDNFGFYGGSVNNHFTCTENDASTTSWLFGN